MANTLEEVLKIKSEQVILVDSIKYQHPGVGTVLPTHGVPINAFMILSALFGIIAAVFFIRGTIRQVRYCKKNVIRFFSITDRAPESEKFKIDAGFVHDRTCICEGMCVVCNEESIRGHSCGGDDGLPDAGYPERD